MGFRVAGAALMAAAGLAGCAGSGLFGDRSELVLDPQVCVLTTVPVYFAEGEAGLSRPARELLDTTADTLRGCQIRRVNVMGLADSSGSAARNQTLSERRALAVTQALEEAGWPQPAFEVQAAGEAGAAEAGVEEPVRRRVEIVIEAAPPGTP